MLANLPRSLPAVLHGVALTVLFVLLGSTMVSMSVDLAAHYQLTHEIMSHGFIRPDATELGPMLMYPPLSHWIAAVVGWLTGSGLVALWLISITAIYLGYVAILHALGSDGDLGGIVIFAITFAALKSSHALLGQEVIGNFFYPQLIATVFYLAALSFAICRKLPLKHIVVLTAAAAPVLFWTQPLVAMHLATAAIVFLAADGICIYRRQCQIEPLILFSIPVLALEVFLLTQLPKVAALMSYASNNGALEFNFPRHAYAIPFAICTAISLANLALGMRSWPDGYARRIFGSAGTAAGALSFLQLLALVGFGAGSPYAVKKHGFLIVTLGAANLAQLIGGLLPRRENKPLVTYLAIILAFAGTLSICRTRSWANVADVIAASRFADHYAQTSPQFEPNTVSSAISSFHPTLNLLISWVSFDRDWNQTAQYYGKIDPTARYVLIERQALAAQSCAVAENSHYAIAPPSCIKTAR